MILRRRPVCLEQHLVVMGHNASPRRMLASCDDAEFALW